jgi:hypothetical protein
MAKDEEIPIQFEQDLSGEDRQSQALAQQIAPEDFYQYKALLIEPAMSEIQDKLNRNFQLGNLSKDEYEKAQFIYGLINLCLRYKKTMKAGLHFFMELNNMFVSSNSKEGFLRRNEATTVKVNKVEQTKGKKVVDKMQW